MPDSSREGEALSAHDLLSQAARSPPPPSQITDATDHNAQEAVSGKS